MRKTYILLLGLAFLLALLASPFASSFPDGLEKVAQTKGFIHLAEKTEPVVQSPIPDYSLPGIKNEKTATSLAGGIGTLIVFGLGYGISMILKRARATQKI